MNITINTNAAQDAIITHIATKNTPQGETVNPEAYVRARMVDMFKSWRREYILDNPLGLAALKAKITTETPPEVLAKINAILEGEA
jgi:hypothetical protein